MTGAEMRLVATPQLPLIFRATAAARRTLRGPATRLIYRSGLMRPLRQALSARAPDGMTMVRICGGALEGASMLVDLSREKYYWLGTHEQSVQRLLRDRVRAGSVVYDIGAHAGFFSLLCARLVGAGGRVIAFEPRAENAARLRANAAANGAVNIEVRELAASDSGGEAAFVMCESSLEGYLADAGGGASDARVRTETIDSLVGAGMAPPDLLKIDVEGAEGRVIRGAARTIAAHRPEMLIEIHTHEAGAEVVDALPVGYLFEGVDTGARAATPLAPGHYFARPVIETREA